MNAAPCLVDLEQRRLRRFLCVFWLLGLLCGCGTALALDVHLTPAWIAASSPWPWVVRLLVEVFCAAMVLWGLSPWLVCTAAFYRAAIFGYTAQGVQACYGSAGWLLWPLVLGPRLLIFPFLFFLAHRPRLGVCLLCTAAAVAIGFADFRLVMPFVAFLIE